MREGFFVPPLSINAILRKAREFREALKMENSLYFDIVGVTEFLAYGMNFFDFEVVDDSELAGAYAYYDPLKNTLKIRNSVYEEACLGNGRHRFTLAHEIAHWYLHSNKVVLARTSTGCPVYYDSEWQANTFASMLLMDPDLIRNLSADAIAERCMVSYQAATIAKKKLR